MNILLNTFADAGNQPVLPENIAWVRHMLIIIFVLFLLALIVGPIVRARTPRESLARHTEEPGVREDPPHH
jgi:hypothetical protein